MESQKQRFNGMGQIRLGGFNDRLQKKSYLMGILLVQNNNTLILTARNRWMNLFVALLD